MLPHVFGDRSLELLARGYTFGRHHFDRLGSDVFTTRLMARPVTIVYGSEWARFFYEGARFTRHNALPATVRHSLQDDGSVQTLAGDAHRRRKALFLDLLDEPSRLDLDAQFAEAWSTEWDASRGRPTSLLDVASRALTAAACAWAGIPLDPGGLDARTEEFMAMIDGAGSFGPRNVRGRVLRLRTERWARDLIREAREGGPAAGSGILSRLATYRDGDGALLDEEVAAVELLNLLRPTVAVARFIVFAALALHLHPQWRPRVASDPAQARAFAQEVRRTTPFFPMVAGTAGRDLAEGDTRFAEGDWVMLDLFSTLRDPRIWEDPLTFAPERFASGDPHRNTLIPQGAGFFEDGHRCPGEPATVDLVATAAARLAASDFLLPPQDLSVSLGRLPAQPRDGFRVVPV